MNGSTLQRTKTNLFFQLLLLELTSLPAPTSNFLGIRNAALVACSSWSVVNSLLGYCHHCLEFVTHYILAGAGDNKRKYILNEQEKLLKLSYFSLLVDYVKMLISISMWIQWNAINAGAAIGDIHTWSNTSWYVMWIKITHLPWITDINELMCLKRAQRILKDIPTSACSPCCHYCK